MVYTAVKCILLSLGLFMQGYVLATTNPINFAIGISAPYAYKGEDNRNMGTLVDIGELLSLESGVRFDIYLVPTVRILTELKSGSADFAIMPSSNALDEVAERVAKISDARIVMIVNKNSAVAELPITNITNQRVGHIRGVFYEQLFTEFNLSNRVPLLTVESGIEMLLKGRLDYLVSLERTLAYHLKNKDIDENVEVVSTLREIATYLYVSKKMPGRAKVKQEFNKIIRRLHQQRRIEAIYRHLNLTDNLSNSSG